MDSTVHTEPLKRSISPSFVVAYTLAPVVPHNADTVLTLGNAICTHALPIKRSMVPASPPIKPSPVLVAHTLVSVAWVGTATVVQLLPFQRYTKPNSPTAYALSDAVVHTSSRSGARLFVVHAAPPRSALRNTAPRSPLAHAVPVASTLMPKSCGAYGVLTNAAVMPSSCATPPSPTR